MYVVGKGRSGSTLLDDLLGTIPGVASLGELRQLWSRGFTGDYRCACGRLVRECDVWCGAVAAAVGSTHGADLTRAASLESASAAWRRIPAQLVRGADDGDRAYGTLLGRLYDDLGARLGAQVLVDSSKWPVPVGALGAVPGWEAWILHLVRDPRAVAHSYRRRKGGAGQPELPRFGAVHSSLSWSARNAAAELGRRVVPPARFRRIRYEDLVADPPGTVRSLADWLGLDGADRADGAFVDDRTVVLGEAHLVGGNPRRLERGMLTIAPDDEWSTTASGPSRLVGGLTAPLRLRYGYR